jgi:hypothetical protein
MGRQTPQFAWPQLIVKNEETLGRKKHLAECALWAAMDGTLLYPRTGLLWAKTIILSQQPYPFG